MKKRISKGTVHTLPDDLKVFLYSHKAIFEVWEDITPLARNEWICWITSAKKEETKQRRITILSEKLLKGERRPCCWAGCPHR